ncbi:MAG: hypothetical protein AMJ69_11060 [Gammaproteobacteria bacterium SG8_47]|nr:MAG: hypothetical protein AMJ69_11060 [Gammaproteobacteria bacterium SG8_47]
MRRKLLAVAVPPLAVCRYGCASRCAAPIGVFWVTGIVSMIYAFYGGPTGVETLSWGTFGLGIALWTIAVVWALDTIRGVDQDQADPGCTHHNSNLCSIVRPRGHDSDPFDEVRKLKNS